MTIRKRINIYAPTISLAAYRELEFADLRAVPKLAQNILFKKDVADMIGRTPRTVERWVKAGVLPAPRYLMGQATWTVGQLDAWLAGRGEERPCRRVPQPTSA